ncbi:helix-turn-helix domain-containing protein [Treponema denticola]|uniref:HTH cro/C1-type domain-containing protein n=1 Tax=Treponema denticola SP33 TaxID=999437 RepID=M2BN31_TREDN|nr:XRE family transcriptional regulator [Treponema denticola]EMB22888.1 hypothetical protein HMPREF9733_01711 [Treponema denticola SP33]EPF35289.1 hypothetical protein HMPREF9732_02747 [Treponema denticola SP32]
MKKIGDFILFSERIRQIREVFNLSQSDFAKKINISQSAVSEFENNTREPSKAFIIAVQKLGISIDWFFSGEGNIFTKTAEANKAKSCLVSGNTLPIDKATNCPIRERELHSDKATNSPTKNVVSNGIESLAIESTAPKFAELEEKLNSLQKDLQAQIDELKGAVEKKQIEEAYNSPPAYTPDPKLRPYSDLHVAEPQINYGLKKELSEPEETEDLPLAENLAAGIPIEAFDSGETYAVPKKFLKRGKKYCVAKIKGTSMTEAGIVDGSFVLLEYTDTALSGEIMVVKYGEQTTLKRLFQKEDGSWELLYEDGSGAVIPLKDGDWEVKGHYVRVVN